MILNSKWSNHMLTRVPIPPNLILSFLFLFLFSFSFFPPLPKTAKWQLPLHHLNLLSPPPPMPSLSLSFPLFVITQLESLSSAHCQSISAIQVEPLPIETWSPELPLWFAGAEALASMELNLSGMISGDLTVGSP